MNRSEQHMQGYRHAWRDAISYLHEMAIEMEDPHAKALLNSAAFSLGCRKGYDKIIPLRFSYIGDVTPEIMEWARNVFKELEP